MSTSTYPESINWSAGIQTRPDGSFVVTKNGYLYHIPAGTRAFADEFAHAQAFAAAHPELVTPEPQPEPPTLEELRAGKLREIKAAFETAESEGHVLSTLGFEIDANERANRDIAGLITMMASTGREQTYFCDYNNVMRAVSLENLRTMQLEVIGYGQSLYTRKWALREAALTAKTPEELAALHWDGPSSPADQTGSRTISDTGETKVAGSAEEF